MLIHILYNIFMLFSRNECLERSIFYGKTWKWRR
nr:MAG TPA: hypothetical protein [Caudoviricetes sp.]